MTCVKRGEEAPRDERKIVESGISACKARFSTSINFDKPHLFVSEKQRVRKSNQDPLSASLDKFIKHHTYIVKCKPTDIKTEKLGGMPSTEFEADERL